MMALHLVTYFSAKNHESTWWVVGRDGIICGPCRMAKSFQVNLNKDRQVLHRTLL